MIWGLIMLIKDYIKSWQSNNKFQFETELAWFIVNYIIKLKPQALIFSGLFK